ncbi:MAG TPA: acyltransferase family protein [Thermoleophilaceae bacterium]
MRTPAATGRYNDLDALRAFTILVVVAFHVGGVSYTLPVDGGRPVELWLTWCVKTADQFQMPVFFVMSGFFGALAVRRRGSLAFLRGRLERIGIPLLVAWLVLGPLLNLIAIYGQHVRGRPQQPIAFDTLVAPKLHHLWFLAYLLLFCAAALVLRAALAWSPRLASLGRRAFEAVARTPARLAVLVPMTALLSWNAQAPTTTGGNEFIPDLGTIARFGPFFAFGWILYGSRELLLPRLRAAPGAHIAVALAASILLTAVVDQTPGDERTTKALLNGLGAIVAWTATLGLMGLFHRWFNRPGERVRYGADAAYWIYLGHLPLVNALSYALVDVGAPFALRILLVPAITVGLLLLAYDRLVRYTPVGSVLHGRRSRYGASSRPGTGSPASSAAQA